MLSVKIQTASQTGQPLYWKEGKIFKVLFTVTPTNVNSPGNANPYVAGGDTLDLTQLFNLLSSAPGSVLPTFEAVAKVEFQSTRPAGAANNGNLFEYSYAPGTTMANGTMQIFTGAAAQTALTELSAGNYPAAVLGDTIQGEAYFIMP
jgi:hypothetical protein